MQISAVTTSTKSGDSPACSRWPVKLPAMPKPGIVDQFMMPLGLGAVGGLFAKPSNYP